MDFLEAQRRKTSWDTQANRKRRSLRQLRDSCTSAFAALIELQVQNLKQRLLAAFIVLDNWLATRSAVNRRRSSSPVQHKLLRVFQKVGEAFKQVPSTNDDPARLWLDQKGHKEQVSEHVPLQPPRQPVSRPPREHPVCLRQMLLAHLQQSQPEEPHQAELSFCYHRPEQVAWLC